MTAPEPSPPQHDAILGDQMVWSGAPAAGGEEPEDIEALIWAKEQESKP